MYKDKYKDKQIQIHLLLLHWNDLSTFYEYTVHVTHTKANIVDFKDDEVFFLEKAFNVFGIKICHKKRQEETFRICTCENIFFQNKI